MNTGPRQRHRAMRLGRRQPLIVVLLSVPANSSDFLSDVAEDFVNANGTPVIPNVAVKFNESIVRGGINYRFSL